jgi:hypothetical protein
MLKKLTIFFIGLVLGAGIVFKYLSDMLGSPYLFNERKYEQEIYSLAGYMGTTEALSDFKSGIKRKYILNGKCDSDFSLGTYSGNFELWQRYYYPLLGKAHTLSSGNYIHFYNSKMSHMEKNPIHFGFGIEREKMLNQAIKQMREPSNVE